MTMSDKFGIETIRQAVTLFNDCSETFNQQFTATELLQLAAAHQASDFDFYPDQWTERQIKEALRGIVPQWDDNEQPSYKFKV